MRPVNPVNDYRACGPAGCEPFGGVERAVSDGTTLFQARPATPIGIVAGMFVFGVDAPLSLVGDIVTLPVVYGRQLADNLVVVGPDR